MGTFEHFATRENSPRHQPHQYQQQHQQQHLQQRKARRASSINRRGSSPCKGSGGGGGRGTTSNALFRSRSGSVPPDRNENHAFGGDNFASRRATKLSRLPSCDRGISVSSNPTSECGTTEGGGMCGESIPYITSPVGGVPSTGGGQGGSGGCSSLRRPYGCPGPWMLERGMVNGGGVGAGAGGRPQKTPPSSADSSPYFCPPCAISLEERLIKTSPIWFLPDLQRMGAAHLLKDKEEGNFLVRASSHPSTLAISVRLPPSKGPYIQHYLVERHTGGQSLNSSHDSLEDSFYSLEASDNRFSSLPELIAYYTKCCDELPVPLKLPRCVEEARSRKELASIGLLGQEFWATRMATPVSSPIAIEEQQNFESAPAPRPKDLSFSSFGKAGLIKVSTPQISSPLTPSMGGSQTPITPSRPAPPIPISPLEKCTNLNLTPLDDALRETMPSFSSFRSTGPPNIPNGKMTKAGSTKMLHYPNKSPPFPVKCQKISETAFNGNVATEICRANFPPTPPTRSSASPPQNYRNSSDTPSPGSSNSITLTTTLTLNVDHGDFAEEADGGSGSNERRIPHKTLQLEVSNLEISSANNSAISSSNTPPTNSICSNRGIATDRKESLKLHIRQSFMTSAHSNPCSPASPTTPLDTPMSEEGDAGVRRRRKLRKDKRRLSTHYKESNIIEGPNCYRSSLADKISDYEDLWSSPPREDINSRLKVTPSTEMLDAEPQPPMVTFKPKSEISKSMGDLFTISQKHISTDFDMNTKDNDEAVVPNGVYGFDESESDIGGFNLSHILRRNSNDSSDPNRKTSSPFYVEPADALREFELKNMKNANKMSSNKLNRKFANRFSDSNIQWRARWKSKMGKIDSNDNINEFDSNNRRICLSSSFEDLIHSFENERRNNITNINEVVYKNRRSGLIKPKPVLPPRLNDNSQVPNRVPWRVDSSWEYLNYGNVDNENEAQFDGRFPPIEKEDSQSAIIPGNLTVQSLIEEKIPNLASQQPLIKNGLVRTSEYDNVSKAILNRMETTNKFIKICHNSEFEIEQPKRTSSRLSQYMSSNISDSGTEFSEPWDSRKWDHILNEVGESVGVSKGNINARDDSAEGITTDSESMVQVTGESGGDSNDEIESISRILVMPTACQMLMDPDLHSRIYSPQLLALRHRRDALGGRNIREYALRLGSDETTVLHRGVRNFITCTLESPETDPSAVVRNVRQFMSGMKNFLTTSGEGEFQAVVRKECGALRSDEFLNLDAILEDVMVQLILKPLWAHINGLYVERDTKDGSIQALANSMIKLRKCPQESLGLRPDILPKNSIALKTIHHLLSKMQRVFVPREKLAHLLGTVSIIFQAIHDSGGSVPRMTDAEDEIVPLLMWVLCQSEVFPAQIEAEYMQGLLVASACSGEADYYLSAFHSSVHAIKNSVQNTEEVTENEGTSTPPTFSKVGVLKVIVPDEQNGSIVTRSVPVRPTTTAREVCKMMAHKLKVTNPQDFGLYKLVNGEESLLADTALPSLLRPCDGKNAEHCFIAYKRVEAKIAWPIKQ